MLYDAKQITEHLSRITARWNELDDDAYFEIRCLKENSPAIYRKFKVNQLNKAVDLACEYNAKKYNVYTTINPISSKSNGQACTDSDILCSFFCFADADTPDATENIRQFKEIDYNFFIYTGKKPNKRGHIYYELSKPIYDMQEWTLLQKGIAYKLKTDEVVVNPSRILRLSGTVSYPTIKKQQLGREEELTSISKYNKTKHTITELKKIFNYRKDYKPDFTINLPDFNRTESLDIQNAIANIRSGNEWHNNMIKVVASLVARSRSDTEIHHLLDITLPGYSYDDTYKEVQVAIDGARSKGFKLDNISKPQQLLTSSKHEISEMFHTWKSIDPNTIPKRQYLYSNHYIKAYTSLTIAAPGIGKSSLVLTEAISIVTGKDLLEEKPREKVNVFYYNSEDPLDEIQRRVISTIEHYDIEQTALTGLHIASGRDTELLLAEGNDGIINEELFQKLEEYFKQNEIGLFILDPLQNMHSGLETNEVFRNIGKRLSQLADSCNCSIEIVHHTRKSNGMEATVDDARGGSSLIGTVRSARILSKMTKAESENLGLSTHIDHFKISAGKNNLTRAIEEEIWYRRQGVQISNGDWVAVIERWNPPSVFDGISTQKCQALIKLIKDSEIYLLSNIRTTRNEFKMSIHEFIADFLDINFAAPQTKSQVKRICKTWLQNDVIKEKTIDMKKVDPQYYRNGIKTKIIVPGSTIPGVI